MTLELELISECDPTDTGIAKPVEKEPEETKPDPTKDKAMDTKFMWTVDGPRCVIEICWGLKRLAPIEDF